MELALTRAQFVRWRTAVFAIFAASGLSIASWASRTPAITDALGINNAGLGLMLLIGGCASITGLSVSSLLLARFGARRSMLVMMLVFATGLLLIGIGTDVIPAVPLVVVGLALWGFGNGTLDVIMNVEGAAIETQSGRTLLPLFHAFFSFGTVIGAGLGTLLIAWGWNVVTHLGLVSAVIAVTAIVSISAVPAREGTSDPDADPTAPPVPLREKLRTALSAWREPRTYTLGIVMLGMAFAEGGANDWLALSVVEGHEQPESSGALALTVFSVSMTAVRLVGGPLVDRFGRVATLRVLAVASASGLLLFIFAPAPAFIFIGAALWGAGTSLGFPLGMSAAADDPARAAARVSAAATIGYIAFLGGPPLLGLISEQIGLLNTLLIVVGLIVASGLASSAARPLSGSSVGGGHH